MLSIMILIYLILLVFINFVISPEIPSFPLRKDYYKSSSNPAICMEILHFFPTGPLYIYAEFYYQRYFINYDYKPYTIKTKYSFIRVDIPCETSVIFSTYGENFKTIFINIDLFLARNSSRFSYFIYELFNGIKPQVYELWDRNKVFGMRVKVIRTKNYEYENKTYNVGGFDSSYKMGKLDKKSMKLKNNALCIITENNLAAVLKIEKEFLNSSDFIISLNATIYRNDKIFASLKYDAYECYKDDTYPDVPVVFITDEKNLKVEFEVIFASYSFSLSKYQEDLIQAYSGLEIFHSIFDDVHNLKNIPQIYARVFLMNLKINYKDCRDGSRANLYLSNDKTICFIIVRKKIEIFYNVIGSTKINRSPDDPCNKLKNKEYI